MSNFLLAAILYFVIALAGANSLSPTVGKLQENSPAFRAGIQENDVIVRINNAEIKTWEDIGKFIRSSQGPLTFFIQRDGKFISKTINPHISDAQNISKRI